MNIDIVRVDYNNPEHARDLVWLLDDYAKDPMGGNSGLSDSTKENLAATLATLPHAFSLICYVDGKPAGLTNCIEGFSTFKCKPLVNIHDITVTKEFRGLGLSHKMLTEVEVIARERGCCKLTLEVLQGNEVARLSYQKFGFAGYELDPNLGRALFWEKPL